MRGSKQRVNARAAGLRRRQSQATHPPTRLTPPLSPRSWVGRLPVRPRLPGRCCLGSGPPGPPPPLRTGWQLSGAARQGPGCGRRRAAPFLSGKVGAGRHPQPAGPFGHRPVGPLTLHHLLRLLLTGTALSRHVGCSSPFRNLSPQALQPIRAPNSELTQPMESQRRGLKPRRACAAAEPHG